MPKAIRTGVLTLHEDEFPERLLEYARHALTYPNPRYESARKRNPYAAEYISPTISYSRSCAGGIQIPRNAPLADWCDFNGIDDLVTENQCDYPEPFKPFKSTIVLEDFQDEIVNHVMAQVARGFTDHLIVAPTGSGKTVIGVELIARLDTPTLILVNKTSLMYQWRESIREFLGIEPGIIGDSVRSKGEVVISTVQSHGKQSRDFGLVILDEAHRLTTQSIGAINSVNAHHRIGLTATPYRKDGAHRYLFDLFFDGISNTVTREEAEKANRIVSATVRPYAFHTMQYLSDFNKIVEAISNDQNRDRDLVNLINMSDKPTVVLTRFVKHADRLGSKIPGAEVYHGKTKNKAEVMARIKSGVPVTVTTFSIFGEGTDIPCLARLVFATPIGSKTSMFEQSVGRVLRKFKGKGRAEIIDPVDAHIYLKNAWYGRQQRYIQFGFEVEPINTGV